MPEGIIVISGIHPLHKDVESVPATPSTPLRKETEGKEAGMEAELAMADAEFFPSVLDMFKLRYKAIECMIEKFPGKLIVGDAWRALPLLYASSWEDAPSSSEIIHSLVNSHQSLYPDHEFHWLGMLIYLGRANAPTCR